MTHRRPVVVLIVVGILVSLLGTPSYSQTDDEPTIEYLGDPAELWIGPWTGMLFAGGTGTFAATGLDISYNLDLSGSADIMAEEETITGEFNLGGSYSMFGQTSDSTLTGSFSAHGGGEVSGTPMEPRISGVIESDGEVTVTASGFSQTVDAGSPGDLDVAIDLEVAICNEVYGNFTAGIEQRLEDVGWTPEVQGNFIAVQDEEVIRARLEEWRAGMAGFADTEGSSQFPDGTPDIVRVFDDVLRRYNSWADYVNAENPNLAEQSDGWTLTVKLINDIDLLYARLRNLAPCERQLLGPLADKFANVLTRAVLQTIIRVGFAKEDITGGQIWGMAQMALNAGAYGSGSLFPADAARANEALQHAAMRVLERYVVADNPDCAVGLCLINNSEVKRILTVAVQLRWDLVVGGVGLDADWIAGTFGLAFSNNELVPLANK